MPATTASMKRLETATTYLIKPFDNLPALDVTVQNNLIQSIMFACDENNNYYSDSNSSVITQLNNWFTAYQSGAPKSIDSLPLNWTLGSTFRQKVWQKLNKLVPYGQTISYGDLSVAITGSSASARAVGMAMNRNPWVIVVPCHRVVGSTGSLTGYAGGLDIKKQLLFFENAAKIRLEHSE